MQDTRFPTVRGREQRSLMTTSEAAALVHCRPATIWRAARSGELPAVRLGPKGSYRIEPEALAEWLHPETKEDA